MATSGTQPTVELGDNIQKDHDIQSTSRPRPLSLLDGLDPNNLDPSKKNASLHGTRSSITLRAEESNLSRGQNSSYNLTSEKSGLSGIANGFFEDKQPRIVPTQNTPPDGGLQAWLQVLGSWMLFFNSWGILNTFGVFQTYYESGAVFEETSSNISWIGSIQALSMLLASAVAGSIYDRGGYRYLLFFGSFCVVFGHMMLSLCKAYWQVLLAQGVLIGMGGGCLYVPGVAIMPTYFSSRLGLALGLAAFGSSTGGIIYPIMFYKLVDEVSFGWTCRIIGFTALATLIVPLATLKMRVKPDQVRSIIDWSAFTDWQYLTFVAGMFVGFTSLYVAAFYTSFFGQATEITDESLSFYLIPIFNAGSVLGRIVPNWLSDRIGPLNVLAPSAFLGGIVLLCNIAVHDVGGIVITSLLFGFFSGVFVAMPPAVFYSLTADKSRVGTRIGMGLAMAGLGVLIGGPGAGALLGDSDTNLNWKGVWTFAGIMALAAGIVFSILRVWRAGFRVQAKV